MSFIEKRKKHSALKSYALNLSKLLSKNYGKSDFYTPAQVSICINKDKGLTTAYEHYALAMFCTKADFDIYTRERHQYPDYDAHRNEIGDVLFHGNHQFTGREIDRFDLSSSALPPSRGVNESVN